MDDVIVHDGPLVRNGHFALPNKAGLGLELNREIVEAHLVPGEKWWGWPLFFRRLHPQARPSNIFSESLVRLVPSNF